MPRRAGWVGRHLRLRMGDEESAVGTEMIEINGTKNADKPKSDGTMSALEEANGPARWPEGSNKRAIFEFLEGSVWAVLITFFTFWALFAPDLIQVLVPKGADKALAAITLVGFILFFSEIILNFVVKRDYGGNEGVAMLTWFPTR